MSKTIARFKTFRYLDNAEIRSSLRMAAISVFGILLLILFQLVDFGGLLTLLIVVCLCVFGSYCLFSVFRSFFRRRFISAGVSAVSFWFIVYFAGIPFLLIGKYEVVAAYLYATNNSEAFERVIQKNKRSLHDAPSYVEFLIGGGYATPVMLVYDESLQLLLPYEQRSKAWRDEHANSEFTCVHSVQQVKKNYFLVNFAC